MKSIFKTLALVTVAVTTLVACQNDIDKNQQATSIVKTFKFYAQTADAMTKATLTPNEDETTFVAAWEGTDAMALDTYGTGIVNDQPVEFAAVGTASWDDNDQSFEATYEPGVTVPTEQYTQWTYKAFYPWNDLSFGSERTQDGNNFNSEYDLMYGTLQTANCKIGKNADGSPIVIPMNRLTAIAYYHIQDANAPDEDVVSATLTVDEGKVIAAELVEISNDGTTITPSDGSNSITITFDEGTAPKATNFQLWFNLLTETIGQASAYNVTVDIETTGHTAKLTSKSARSFTAGKLNRAKISSLTWTEKPIITKGTEYTLATSSDLKWTDISTALEHNSMSWTPAVVTGHNEAKVENYDSSRGAHFGSGNKGVTEMTFTGTGYSTYCQSATACGISDITVNVGAQNGKTVTGVVTVGGVEMSPASDGSDSYMAANTVAGAISFHSDVLLTGDIVIDLTLSASGPLYVKDIIINPDSRIDPEFAYDPSSYTAIVNGTLDTPTLSYVSGFEGTITYSIGENDDPDVADVDATTGDVTIGSELGTVTVTASFAGNETYKSDQASYTIEVVVDPNNLESKTIAQFIELADTDNAYRVTGTVSSAINTSHNSFDLTDGTGTIMVWELDDVSSFVEGDIVTLHGTYSLYNSTHELVNGVYESSVTTPKLAASVATISANDSDTEKTFNVVADSSVAWTIASDNPDLSISPASGTGNAEITVTFSANNESTEKTATITVSSETENVYKEREIEFVQSGKVTGKPATVTYDATDQGYENSQSVSSWSSTPLSISFNNAKYYDSGSALRVYGGGYFEISTTVGAITNVALTFGTGGDSNAITSNVGNFDAGVWTGSASSVRFTVGGTSGNRRIKTITITYIDPNATVEDPTLTVDNDFELVVGKSRTLTVNTNSDGEISYLSSNTSVATVVDGVVTAVAPGNATITVSVAEAEWYKAASETVDVTVVAKAVESLTVTGLTTSYTIGDDFDATCTVTANYNDDSAEEIDADDYTMTVTKDNVVVSDLTNLAEGTYYATVTYDNVSSDPIEITVSDDNVDPTTYVDVLTASMFTATGNTYAGFSNVSYSGTGHSDAQYAGQSAKDSSSNIQLRSKNSNSGIVSTTSGGKVKSIKITVGSGTNTIDVYGSNTAYTSASDLYGDNKGTKLGSLSATGTITVTNDYAYVGIRSNSGAIYLSSIEITWEN